MTITFLRRTRCDDPSLLVELHRRGATAVIDAEASQATAAGVLAVSSDGDPNAAAWICMPGDAIAQREAGAAAWQLTVLHNGTRSEVLDGLVRSGAPWLQAQPENLAEALSITGLPACHASVSVEVDSIDDAVAAVRAGANDLVVGPWDADTLGALRDALAPARLIERVAFPLFLEIDEARTHLSAEIFFTWLSLVDGCGAARPRYEWAPGRDMPPPVPAKRLSAQWSDAAWVDSASSPSLDGLSLPIASVLERSLEGIPPTRDEVELLFTAHGHEVEAVAWVADVVRERTVGDRVTYVINRNINYTNQCYFKCGFCGFSRGPKSAGFKDAPYVLETHEVVRRSVEAAERGATEVCLVGGIHPRFTGDFYAGIVEAVKARLPEMHIHGFTPLEVWQGAETLGVSVNDFLERLRDAGLGTLPGTAAEILDDQVRAHLCPDKITTAEWADVMITAHRLGLRATSTIMHGHIDHPRSWANHYEVLREVQRRTGGFTEFVPLPFVHMGAPIYLQQRSRPGPTWDEVVLIHAVARLAFDGLIPNIQASWVKLGLAGGARLLGSGCNDLGGTLMNESISRSSGAEHGQLATPQELEDAIRRMGRVPVRRNTVYELQEPLSS